MGMANASEDTQTPCYPAATTVVKTAFAGIFFPARLMSSVGTVVLP